jgi:hypothetical protein
VFNQRSFGKKVESQSATIKQILRTGIWIMDQQFQIYPDNKESLGFIITEIF